jgi:hypothetical protein
MKTKDLLGMDNMTEFVTALDKMTRMNELKDKVVVSLNKIRALKSD